MHPKLSAFLSRRVVDRRGGHRARVLAAFEAGRRFDFYRRELMDQKRDEKLATLLNHARQHVPFFRAHFEKTGEITPQNARQALGALPVMTRAEIQADPARFIAENAKGLVDDATGGSTGTPMKFKVDRDTQVAREASLIWANDMTGLRYGERVAMLWGSDRDVKKSISNSRLALRWRIENIRWFNAFNMGEAEMAKFHAALQRFSPHLVVAYAGSIYTFARFLEAKGWRPKYPILGVVSSAEMLLPEMRRVVESVFHCQVFDRYGNREAGAIAAECNGHSGLHINESDFYVEIASPDPFKKPGPVLITYFRNLAMPLIRYDTGDLGRFEAGRACACSRQTLRMAPIVGRQADHIRTASGKIIHGEFFTHVLYGSDLVREFQFVQESLSRYVLRVVADRQAAASHEPQWREKIIRALGPGSELHVEYVASIPPLPSGKRKFTVSNLSP